MEGYPPARPAIPFGRVPIRAGSLPFIHLGTIMETWKVSATS